MNPLVSIIIPAFNSERYIEDAVLSAVSQTHKELEIICVDDGSTDQTPAILERLAATIPEIRLLRQPNGGVSVARNAGIRAATGGYVFFLDSDDLLTPEVIEFALRRAQQTGADAVIPRLERFSDHGMEGLRLTAGFHGDLHTTITGDQALEASVGWQISGLALWRATIFSQVWFDANQSSFSDELSVMQMLAACRTVAFCEGTYRYRIHPKSITHSANRVRLQRLAVDERIETLLTMRGCSQRSLDQFRIERLRRLMGFWVMFSAEANRDALAITRSQIVDSYCSLDRQATAAAIQRSDLPKHKQLVLRALLLDHRVFEAMMRFRTFVSTPKSIG